MAEPRQSAQEIRQKLHAAVESSDHAELERLVRLHPGFIDAPNESGRAPLMMCVEKGDQKAAQILLEAGAAVNTHAPAGSALEVAADRSDAPMVQLLLEHHGGDVRVAFRIASQRRARPIMEMLAYREPTLQLQMEFDAQIPDQKLIATEPLSRRLPEPVLTLDGKHVLHLGWDGVRNTYLETSAGKADRTFSVEVQHRLHLFVGERELGVVDGMWYSALASGPATKPELLSDGRWRVRYAYYAVAGSYQHYSAIDLTLDFTRGTLSIEDVRDGD